MDTNIRETAHAPTALARRITSSTMAMDIRQETTIAIPRTVVLTFTTTNCLTGATAGQWAWT